MLEPLAALIAVPIFGLTVATTQFASLGSVAGAASLALLTLFFRGLDSVAIAALATATLIIVRHRSNLRRVLDGTERRLDSNARERL
jgi:glycerol-3-phosphate acyltransferase PlsY